MIYSVQLTLELNVEDVYDVSIRHLRTLFMYWCHVCCLRFWRDNLIVDGRQMVSLISVHGRGSLFDEYGLQLAQEKSEGGHIHQTDREPLP